MTFITEQKEAISKSVSAFAYFTNNPLSSIPHWKLSFQNQFAFNYLL